MGQVIGYVNLYETADGGKGIDNTIWTAKIGTQMLFTTNPHHAETLKCAIHTASKVFVDFIEEYLDFGSIRMVRLHYDYLCEERTVTLCKDGKGIEATLCETLRRAPCDGD